MKTKAMMTQSAESQKMVMGCVPTVAMNVKPKTAGPMMEELKSANRISATQDMKS